MINRRDRRERGEMLSCHGSTELAEVRWKSDAHRCSRKGAKLAKKCVVATDGNQIDADEIKNQLVELFFAGFAPLREHLHFICVHLIYICGKNEFVPLRALRSLRLKGI
jgi:hypothetical protein